jgi:hypothetical protein
MDGRELNLEFASAQAIRRSGLHKELTKDDKGAKSKKRQQRPAYAQDGSPGDEEEANGSPAKKARFSKPSTDARTGAHNRLKPGAALAGAPREQAGIVPSLGKKIVF